MDSLFYGALVLFFLLVEGYFCMIEMGSISYNRIRLQYAISRGDVRSKWLYHLLQKPSRLFGTTIVGVNTALQFGSESARRLYASLGWDPDLALLTQVVIVILFAEFIPMFAGRFYSGSVVQFGIGPLYLISKICAPWVFLVEKLCAFVDFLFGSKGVANPYLSREELQKAFELWGEGTSSEVSRISKAIFELEKRQSKEIIRPLGSMVTLNEKARVKDLKNLLLNEFYSFIPLIDSQNQVLLGIVYPRDVLRLSDNALLKPVCHMPYFVPQNVTIYQLLDLLRRSSQRVAVVLGEKGSVMGFVTLDDLLLSIAQFDREGSLAHRSVYVCRSFPKHYTIERVNALCGTDLPQDLARTLEELLIVKLGHYPARGEGVRVEGWDLVLHENGRKVIIRSAGYD